MYTGKTIDGARDKDQGFSVVNDLVEPHQGNWRTITADNFFTYASLATTRNRKIKRDAPKELSITSRPIELSMFAFKKDISMVSYIFFEQQALVTFYPCCLIITFLI